MTRTWLVLGWFFWSFYGHGDLIKHWFPDLGECRERRTEILRTGATVSPRCHMEVSPRRDMDPET